MEASSWLRIGCLLNHGDHAKTLEALNTARRIAPQQTRYHPMVAETVLTLARARAAPLGHLEQLCRLDRHYRLMR